MEILNEICEVLQKGDVNQIKEKINTALNEGIESAKVLNEGLLKGMDIIGEKFKKNEVFVPEVLLAARAMNAGMEILKPKLVESGVKSRGSVVIGTVQGDLHDIGKNLVKMMLEGAGFDVYDLGTDVSAEQFINAIKEHKPQILGMSALLTTTMNNMEKIIKAVEEEGLRDNLYIMVGGAPVTDKFASEIGADGYAKNAAEASSLAKEIVVV